MSKVVGVRLPDALKDELEAIARDAGVTVSAVVQAAIEGISRGDLAYYDGKIIPTTSYMDAVRPFTDGGEEYEHLKYNRVLAALRDRGYPDYAIRQMNENNIDQIRDMPKFNPRKSREWESC